MMMNIPNLDLDLVRCFLTVAERGGFTAASVRLNLSQSAVSLKVRRLEALLGKSLFERTSRALRLTPEGEILSAYGKRLLALNREMVERISKTPEVKDLRLGVTQQFGQSILPGLLSEFRRTHPGIHLSIEAGMTGDLLTGMEKGLFDLVLGAAGHGTGLEVNEERLPPREKVVWVRAAASTIDLTGDPLPLALFPPPCGYRRGALERLRESGRSWRFVYTGTSLQSIQAAVQADIGIGVFARKSVCPGLKVIPPEAGLPPLPDLEISLYRHRAASTASVHSLSAFITRTLAAGRTARDGFIE